MKNSTAYILLFILVAIGGFILYRDPNHGADLPVPTPQQQTVSEPAPLGSPENPLSEADLRSSAGPRDEDVSSSTPTGPIMVIYSDAGFAPGVITIARGTTVRFENQSSESLWVASNPHPTHTGLPGFDSKKTIGSGQSYTYTFAKTGTFGFHNHLSPNKVGIVVVQ